MNLRLSRVIIFSLLMIVALIPLGLRHAKYISNPREFKKETARYATAVLDVLSTKIAFDQIKVGDVRYDGNGEAIMTILSISKPKPHIIGRASFNGGNYVDIIDEAQCTYYLTLRVRYDDIGDKSYIHGWGSVLGVSYPIDFSNEKYTVRGIITRVDKI